MNSRPYVLLIATGQSPQVVTETVWAFACQHRPALYPAAVHIITTGAGEAQARAQLLGQPQRDPVRGTPYENVADRWSLFCRDVLGRETPVPMHFHVPDAGGDRLNDVRSVLDDEQFANVCYETVAALTRPDCLPVIGSIAGGRKTMSAHLMTAFSVYARPEDRLSHVLVYPEEFERERSFFYPTAETPEYVRIHRIDIRFPRLHRLLAQHLPSADRSDLRSLLDALEPHLTRERTPASIVIELGDGEAFVCMADAEGAELGRCRLTAGEAVIFLAMADAITAAGGRVPVEDLFGSTRSKEHAVYRRMQRLYGFLNRDAGQLTAWMLNDDVSKAVNRVNKRLAPVPILSRYLSIEGDRTEASTRYRWAEPLPVPLVVTSKTVIPPEDWPLRHVPAPETP